MPEDDITQLAVGRFRVGIAGLQQAIAEVRNLLGQNEAEIAEALFLRLKSKNYIPDPARGDYKQAFLREYKKAQGEPVTENHGGLVVKILGPGCPSCERLEQSVMTVLAELNLPADIEHVKDLKEIYSLGVIGTPALMINNELKAMGLTPSRERLKTWLQEAAAKR
jgi:small redox-active disulfide protein 2